MRTNMRYAHFDEICEESGNRPIRNTRQSHIRIKLTFLSDIPQTRVGGGAIVQFPCTGHPTHSTLADYGTGTGL